MNMNPYFKEEFREYLEAAGFRESESHSLAYFKDDRAIIIRNDNIDFMILTEEEPGERAACLSKYMSFWGFSQLDIFKFQLLLHITGYVPLKRMIDEVRKEFGEYALHPLFENLCKNFKTAI